MNLLHIWDAVEADFLREYGIPLVERLDSMTWRQFVALLNNLSPGSAVAARMRAREEDGEADAERVFEAAMAGGGSRR